MAKHCKIERKQNIKRKRWKNKMSAVSMTCALASGMASMPVPSWDDPSKVSETLEIMESIEEVKDIENMLVQLRELLTNAFDDLLDEDDNTSLSSELSHDSGAHSEEKGRRTNGHWKPPVTWDDINHHGGAYPTSTPMTHNPPPLTTPGPGLTHQLKQVYNMLAHNGGPQQPGDYDDQQWEHVNGGQVNGWDGHNDHGNQVNSGHPDDWDGQEDQEDHVNGGQPDDWDDQDDHQDYDGGHEDLQERGQGEGGNEPPDNGGYLQHPNGLHQDGYLHHIPNGYHPAYHGTHHPHPHPHQQDYPRLYHHTEGYYIPNYGPNPQPYNSDPYSPERRASGSGPPNGMVGSGEHPRRGSLPVYGLDTPGRTSRHDKTSSQELMDGYKVQFMGRKVTETMTEHEEKHDNIQQAFMEQGGSTEHRQHAQLQILYKARGRQLDQLQQDYAVLKEDTAREMRVLKHQLALAQGERDGMSESLQQVNQLLQDAQEENTALKGRIAAMEKELDAVKQAKEETIHKLQMAEATMENMTQHVTELGNSESLTRAREQHEAVVSSIQQKHQQETLNLKARLDEQQEELQQKHDEISSLRQQLSVHIKASENAHIERADTINRLTRSLEESQRQVQDLLAAGSSQELGHLKAQLQQMSAAKTMTDDMYTAFKGEMSELKEQLTMYESAASCGVFVNGAENTHSESFAQLGVKKTLDWKTPKQVPSKVTAGGDTYSPENTIATLKAELQKCLSNNKNKREQVTSLQAELGTLRANLESARTGLKKMESESDKKDNRIHELESELAELKLDPSGISGVEKRLRREVERYQRELEDKEQELEETKHRLEEVASNEERLGEINSELNHQMALMVQEFDEDKKTALEKCQEACLQHHEVAKAKLREELMCQQNEDRTKLLEQHDSEIKRLKAELVQCQKELDEVKELYVNICEEKETLEEKLRQDWETKLEEEISKVRSECDQEKDEALDNQQKELTSKSQEKLNKEMWRQEQEEELKRRVQAQVAMAKVAWFDEQRESKEAAVASAVKQVEKQWQLKFEEKIENEVERKMYAAKSKLESDRRLSFENELLERLKLEKKKWEEQTEVQISSAVEKARLKWEQQHQPQDVDSLKAQWMQGQQELIEQEVAKALKEAKDNWEHAQRSEIETALMKAKLQAETELREAVDKVKVTHKQEVESLKLELENLEKESHSAKSSWLAEKQKLLTQKEAEQQKALHELEEQQAAQIKEMQEVQLGILQSNLRNAKEQYDREKTALQKQYEEQIDHLKKRVKSLQSEHAKADSDALQELQQQFCKEKEVLESTWQKRLEDANRSHGHQMETLKTKLQEETESILAEARKEWTLQYEQEMKKACQEVAENQKQLWENERSKLMQKIKDLEEQLQTTHANWESELETLRADMERTQFGKVPLDGSGSKSSPERKYEQQLASLQARLSAKEEELQQSEQFYSARLQNARADLQEECDKAIERLEQEKHRLAEQIDDLKSKLEKLDSRKRELQMVLQQSEEEHRQSVNSYKDKNNELNEKVRQLEEQLKSAKSQQENSLDNLRQHLEEKHMAAVEDFRWKLFESNRDNQAAIERINREHEREIRDLKQKVENQRKEVVCTPVQTDGGLVDAKLLDQLKAHYLETVTKIREDVLRHVNETNSRAAKRVKAEVAKERQATAARVKTFCIRGLEKLLSNMDSARKSKIISAMKELLQQFSPNPTPSSTPKPNPRETPSRNSTEYHGDPVQPTKEHPSLSSQRTQTPGYRNNTAPDVPRLNPEQDQVSGKTSHYVVDLSVKGTVSPGPHGLTQEEPTTPSRESAFHQIGGAGGPHTQQDIFNSDQHGALEFLNRMENQYPSDHSTPAPARVDGRNSKADDRQTSTGNRRVITGNQRNSSRYNNYSSNGEMDIHIGESDGGLSKLPQQPRTYNPSPEKLDSEQDSRCSSPAENFITVRSGRGFQRASCLENGYSNGDNQKPKPSQLQPVRDIPEGRSAGSAMLKPIAMVTRHTQMPSPAPKKLSLKS